MRGLLRYIEHVAHAVYAGSDAITWVLDDPSSAYLPLDGHLPGFPAEDLALVWDDENGWAVVIEPDSRGNLIKISYLGEDILPSPVRVAAFVTALCSGGQPSLPDPPGLRSRHTPDDLAQRLTAYATPGVWTTR